MMKRVVIYAFPLLMLWASAFKLSNWDDFVDSVNTYTLLPESGRVLAVLLVPALEATPFSLLIMRKHIAAHVAVITMILFFTGVVWFHWINNVEPTCSCLGEWARFDEMEDRSLFLIGRNIVMVLLTSAVVGWYTKTNKRVASRQCAEHSQSSS